MVEHVSVALEVSRSAVYASYRSYIEMTCRHRIFMTTSRDQFLIIIFMPFDIVGRSISNVKYSESATGA